MLIWAQVFVVLPAAHLVDHHHHDHDHYGGGVRWLADHDHAHDHAPDHARSADEGDEVAAQADPLGHGADSAAHFDPALLTPPLGLPRLHHHAAAQGPLITAPRALDLARPGHGWSPRAPPLTGA